MSLDETTANIDSESEKLSEQALDELAAGAACERVLGFLNTPIEFTSTAPSSPATNKVY